MSIFNYGSGEKVVASGSVTQANMRISSVDGTAFLDFTAAGALTNYIGNKVIVKDSSGREIVGYIKAAGTGETFSSELVDGWTNNATYPFETWTPGAGAVITQAANTAGGYGAVYKAISSPAGKLYKCVNTYALASGTAPLLELSSGSAGSAPFTVFTKNATSYGTGQATQAFLIWVSNGTTATDFAVSAFSFTQVLTPSATGVTIVTTKGGTTYNFTAKDASFNYNDTSGYTYTIIKVQTNPVVASGSISAGSGKVSLVDGTAFFDGANIAAYADGYHLLAVYDSSNRAAIGWLKAAGGGETLIESVVDGAFTDTANWTEGTAWSVAGGVATYDDSADVNSISQVGWSTTANSLYKLVLTVASAGTARLYVLNQAGTVSYWYPAGVKNLTSGTYTYYSTLPAAAYTGIQILGYTAGDAFTVDNLSFARVTVPSATGATVTSTVNGSTYNWMNKDASFDPNVALTYKVYYVGM